MSQELNNEPIGGPGNAGRSLDGERKRYDGFEGMNYEQPRPPFDPQQANIDRRRKNDKQGEKNSQDRN